VKIKQTLAGVGVALAILGGSATITACGPTSNSGYVDEVQYGYYDPGYVGDTAHYHYYDHPKQVRVKRTYYTSHRYEYSPHGTQHRVTVKHTTTTTHHSNGSVTTTHKRTTTRTTRRGTTTRHRSSSTTRSYRKR
jgi:hypothetical protein